MEKRIIAFFLFTGLFILSLPACHHPRMENKNIEASNPDRTDVPVENNREVIIYGSKTCPHCMAFIQKMDREGINYIFKEVDNDNENFQEMYTKIKANNFQGYINYPVIDIEGEILVAPTFDQFTEVYQ